MQSYIITVLGALGAGIATYLATNSVVGAVAAALAFAGGHLTPSPLSAKRGP